MAKFETKLKGVIVDTDDVESALFCDPYSEDYSPSWGWYIILAILTGGAIIPFLALWAGYHWWEASNTKTYPVVLTLKSEVTQNIEVDVKGYNILYSLFGNQEVDAIKKGQEV